MESEESMNLKKTVYETANQSEQPQFPTPTRGSQEDKRYDETEGGGMLIVRVGYRGPGTVGHAPHCTEGPSS